MVLRSDFAIHSTARAVLNIPAFTPYLQRTLFPFWGLTKRVQERVDDGAMEPAGSPFDTLRTQDKRYSLRCAQATRPALVMLRQDYFHIRIVNGE